MLHTKNKIRHSRAVSEQSRRQSANRWQTDLFVTLLFLILSFATHAQFAPAAGQAGSTAIHKDDTRFKAWATVCTSQLGWQNIEDTALGKVNTGNDNSAIGRAGENGILSLGDGGYATLEFAQAIFNGDGFDFAVFENAFVDSFLELAFVEVSTDGNRFVRFPATSNTQTDTPIGGFGYLRPENINNFAGKYRANYGTPFDLDELKDSAGIDVNNINYVRVIDVIGSLDDAYASRDAKGNKINDPFPTPFPQGGFDLDAAGVINAVGISGVAGISADVFSFYPNPTTGKLFFERTITNGILYDIQGKIVAQITGEETDISFLENGIYNLQLANQLTQQKIILSK